MATITTRVPGGLLDKLRSQNFDPAFEKFWRSASWRSHLKLLVYFVWCCVNTRLETLETQAADHEERIAALETP